MVWFKVDDSFYDHPKVKRIPRNERKGAVCLWTLAGSYVGRQLTDGFLLADDVLDVGGSRKEAQSLVTVGLWHAPGHDCPRCPEVPAGQFLYHDWLIYNPSREKVLAERAAAAERQRRARDKAKSQRDSKGTSNVSHAVTDGVSHAQVTGAVTGPPTRPDPRSTCSSVDLDGGGSVPREIQAPPPPDSPFCQSHPAGTSAACADCRAARLAVEAQRDAQADQELTARRAAARARRECPLCDDNGLRDLGDKAIRCDHQPERTTA